MLLKTPNMTDADWDALEHVSTGDDTIPADAEAMKRLEAWGFVEETPSGRQLTQRGRAKFASKYVP